MDTHEQRIAAYLEQVRAKYSADELKALGAKGQAFKNANGDWSYPIGDAADLSNAVHAVGRGGADHDAIRKYIIGVAKKLGLSSKIPENWSPDGSLQGANSGEPDGEGRAEPTPEDYGIAYGLKDAKMVLAGVKAKQLADPDYQTDPDDQAVMDAINEAEGALDKAIVAQSKDGHADQPARGATNWATPKRAFSSLVEQAPPRTGEIQVRAADDSTSAHFVGYASTTGVAYSVRDWLGEYEETILPGAFAKTLREQENVPLLFNHDGIPLASTASGTSRLSEDKVGLRNEAELDRRDALTNSICVQLQRGVLNKMSFSFRAVKDTWNDTYDERGVNEAALYDSSIVTYPANATTSGELVDAMRSAMGREGRSLWLAEHEFSVRAALPLLVEQRELPGDGDDLLERALRALVHADDVLCRQRGPHGRARTFHVVAALLEARAGKALSAKNQGLLQSALDALSAADRQHAKVTASHQTALGALSDVLGAAGEGNGTPPGNGNPIAPQDGAGPRSKSLRLTREREAELRGLRRR